MPKMKTKSGAKKQPDARKVLGFYLPYSRKKKKNSVEKAAAKSGGAK